MKKTFRFIIAAAAIAALASCSKEIADVNGSDNTPTDGARVIEVSFANSTKTYLGNDGLTPYFEDGDEIMVSNNEESETCTIVISGEKALFSTNLEGELKAIYPASAATIVDGILKGDKPGVWRIGLFKDANICMATINEGSKTATFENMTALLKVILPTATKSFAIDYDLHTDTEKKSISIKVEKETDALYTYYAALTPGVLDKLCFSTDSEQKYFPLGLLGNDGFLAGTMYTIDENNWLPSGAIPGKFSVASGKQVYFSKGNLQAKYNGSTYTWGFATNQHDYVGNAAGNTSIDRQTNGAIVDLFGWVGASSSVTGDAQYGISTSTGSVPYGNTKLEELKSDWGTTINNEGTWRTLSLYEWLYLLGERTVNGGSGAGKCYQYAVINSDETGVYGVILYPDSYTAQTSATSYSCSEWLAMEANGCVFLPAAGARSDSIVSGAGGTFVYWSSTSFTTNQAYYINFDGEDNYESSQRYFGYAVRLITDVN